MTLEENPLVLNLVQAMLGNVRPSLRRVTVRAGDPCRVEIVLDHDSPDEREAIADLLFEFEALHDGAVAATTQIDAGPLPPPSGRVVFLRQEED